MPKKPYLAQYLSSRELEEKCQKSQDPVEMRRWHLLWKISLGWTIKDSAVAVGYSYIYAQKILNRYNRDGERGIISKKTKLVIISEQRKIAQLTTAQEFREKNRTNTY